MKLNEEKYTHRLRSAGVYHEAGKITKSIGLIHEAHLPGASVGSLCTIYPTGDFRKDKSVLAEVIGFRDKRVILMPFEDSPGINNGSQVVLERNTSSCNVGEELLGRVLDAKGMPI